MLSTGLTVPAISAASGSTVVVPFAAGGPSDQLARRIAQGIGKVTGDAAVVLNVPGPLAAYERFRALAAGPDAAAGNAVLLMADLDMSLVLREAAGVDITAVLEPIALLGHRPLAVYAAGPSAVDTGNARLCARGGCALLATSGPASQGCAANLARQLGLPPSQVLSYRATAAAVADLGRVDGGLLCMPALSPVLAGAQGLRLLAWGSPTTLVASMGPAPTLADLGLQPLSHTFVGLFASPDLAADATDQLATAVHSVLADPRFRAWMLEEALLEPAPSLLVTMD